MNGFTPLGRAAMITATAVSVGVRPKPRASSQTSAGCTAILSTVIVATSRAAPRTGNCASVAPSANRATGAAAPASSLVNVSIGPGSAQPVSAQAAPASTEVSSGLE